MHTYIHTFHACKQVSVPADVIARVRPAEREAVYLTQFRALKALVKFGKAAEEVQRMRGTQPDSHAEEHEAAKDACTKAASIVAKYVKP